MQKSTLVMIVLAILSIGAGVYVQRSGQNTETPTNLNNMIILPIGRPLTESPFVDHRGKPFGLDRLRGRWTILFPGFTNCPDICPTTLQMLAGVKQRMQQAGNWGNYQVVLMSVDPQRDTTQRLSSYVTHFDSEFIGINGDVASTEAFARQIGIVFFTKEPNEDGNYEVDHSASIILINPKAEWVGAITTPFKRDDIVDDLTKLAKFYSDDHAHAIEKPTSQDTYSATNVAAANESVNGLSLQQAWIRPPAPAANSAAAYFELRNESDQDIIIVDVESAQFENAMIHDTRIENDVASMRHRSSLKVPAGDSILFAPMSTHVMLHSPLTKLEIGTTIDLTLITSDGGMISQAITVRPQPQ